ncbi:hypothetical protein OIO90_003396 [Microbotryomycetes sp. JL221]|nr:hypothetical protein OIO90_003396 [Microbotryomycetes sp. JL221]
MVPERPNWPDDLAIKAITQSDVKLSIHGAARPVVNALEVDRVQQDIATYGIAGRTWEAALAMQMYLTPPDSPLELDSILYDPPCPLFDHTGRHEDANPRIEPVARTIVEVGSGTGYLSLSVAPWLPSRDSIIMTDLPEVCSLLSNNLEAALRRWLRDHFPSPVVLFSYKVRSLTRETPFWSAFGCWFTFEPVQATRMIRATSETGKGGIARHSSSPPLDSHGASVDACKRESFKREQLEPGPWQRFGLGEEDEIFVFVCQRRPETRGWLVPDDDEELMRGGDDQFERLLLCCMEW